MTASRSHFCKEVVCPQDLCGWAGLPFLPLPAHPQGPAGKGHGELWVTRGRGREEASGQGCDQGTQPGAEGARGMQLSSHPPGRGEANRVSKGPWGRVGSQPVTTGQEEAYEISGDKAGGPQRANHDMGLDEGNGSFV